MTFDRRTLVHAFVGMTTRGWTAKLVGVSGAGGMVSAGTGCMAPRIAWKGMVMAFSEEVSYPGPSYDPATGRLQIGVAEDGRHATWRLNTPGEGVHHGLIVGGPGLGKSSLLRLLMVEAITSRRFGLWAADPTGRHGLKAMLSDVAGRLAENRAETVEMLEAASRVITERTKEGDYTGPTSDSPDILIAMEDCGQVFTANLHATRLAEQVVTRGGPVGVGLVMTTRSTDLAYFGGSRLLRARLAEGNQVALGSDARDHLANLT
jgi:hypothetical protein